MRLSGEAARTIVNGPSPHAAALCPGEFKGIKARLRVKEGDRVKIGTPLFADKAHEVIAFTSPVAGRVSEIVRGERRAVEAVIVLAEGKQSQEPLKVPRKDPSSLCRNEIVDTLLAAGLFPCFIQRPFGTVAKPGDTPRDIFISAMDTAPLAPDVNIILEGKEEYFQRGLSVLANLTSGKVHLSLDGSRRDLSRALTDARDVKLHLFSGPHPAGNVGVHIHHIAPVRHKGDIVWTLNVQSVLYIGCLFATGKLDFSKTVAVAGSAAMERNYFKTVSGSSIRGFVSDRFVGDRITDGSIRFISGDVLSGRMIGKHGYVGFYDNLITVIPEPTEYELFGWMMPGHNKLSRSRTFFSTLFRPWAQYSQSAGLNGGPRAFIASGIYEEVLPMDIYPVFLMKSILAEDIEEMEGLGIYEVIEEDLALCEYIDPSKNEFQTILRRGLDLIEKEG